MKKIIISPYSQKLPNGKINAKNYPYWEEVVAELKKLGFYIIQIGKDYEDEIKGIDEIKKELNFKELQQLLEKCDLWISVDNFFQHFCAFYNKKGIVIFGQSNPLLFGHKENINICKDEKCFRNDQFGFWFEVQFDKEVFVAPNIVIATVKNFFNQQK